MWQRLPTKISVHTPVFLAVAVVLIIGICGTLINATLLQGDYEWTGLIRIFRELMERDGFWCIAFVLYVAGLRAAVSHPLRTSSIRQTLSTSTGRHRALAAAALSVAILAAAIRLQIIGTLADLLSFWLLMAGMVVQSLSNQVSTAVHTRRLFLAAGSSALIFSAYTVVCYFHTMIKGTLFLMTSPADDWMWHLDTSLLGTQHYESLLSWRQLHPDWVRWLDVVYVGLMQQMSWALFFFYGARNWNAGRRYIIAMFSIYLIGPLFYFPAPSAGPLFYAPQLFTDIQGAAPDTWQLSRFLLFMTAAAKDGLAAPIAPFCYIAAMPSLHVGLAVILLLSMRPSVIASSLNMALLVLTIVATNILGWHYISDAIVGAGLGVACWYGAVMLDKRLHASNVRLDNETPLA